MCNLINIHTYIHVTCIHTYNIHPYICVFVCIVIAFVLDVRLDCLWTYQPESHGRKVITQYFYIPSTVLALIFLARRTQPFLSLVDREVKFWCTHELIALHLLFFLFLFCCCCCFVRKNLSLYKQIHTYIYT